MSPQAIAAVTTLINCIVDTILICSSERQTSSLDERPFARLVDVFVQVLFYMAITTYGGQPVSPVTVGLNFRYRCKPIHL